ncbi:MAG TPA: polyprenol monophosphomannose synthase [Mycobacteriales bacterium]|nr:polyprenol monophosphomannose synthase [Mycobacteriales bacterium]
MNRILVCIPTYDERGTLPDTVARLRAAVPAADLLILDDASPDGTGDIADTLAATDAQIHVAHRPGKAGLGAAYVDGFTWGLGRGYDVLVEMDADGSHQPEELPRLLSALRGADVVLGSRWVTGGQVRNWPASRLLLSRGGNAYTRLALGIPIADATGGFRAYRADVLRALPLAGVSSQGYCFQVDLLYQALRAGFRVVEVPITFVERSVGYSKMNRAIVIEALWRVTRWGVTARLPGGGPRLAPGPITVPPPAAPAATLPDAPPAPTRDAPPTPRH